MTTKAVYKHFLYLIFFVSTMNAAGCTALASNVHPALDQTPTPKITTQPGSTLTPTPLELLDERTQYLFNDPADIVLDFFFEMQDSVRTDNKEKLASLIFYPITIHSIDGIDAEIQNADEFIANYEKIVTPKWKSVILAQDAEKLFTNWHGVMVNRGELWFSPICLDTPDCLQKKYLIISITNNTPW